jgi:hypothetical protein
VRIGPEIDLDCFSTWGNSGIEPDKGEGNSSPGTYEASLMWPCNDGGALLAGNAVKPAREQLTLIRIFEELCGRGYGACFLDR